MNDITPPKRPKKQPVKPMAVEKPAQSVKKPTKRSREAKSVGSKAVALEVVTDIPESVDLSGLTAGEALLAPKKKLPIKRIIGTTLMILILGGILLAVGAFLWYQEQLKPVDPLNNSDVKVVIEQGMTPESIGKLLVEDNLVRSELGFDWYLRITQSGNHLQAGAYTLKQNMTMPEIVEYLRGGRADTFRVTFLPGATVADNKKVLEKTGFSKEEVDAAFAKKYDHPILKGKPASADLEGYIYGETYEFSGNASAEDVLVRTFDELQKVVERGNLVAAYKKRGLTLYEGITLASIIQREVSGFIDQRMVAGVFFNRLKAGMTLGSDVTYQYIADKEGKPRDPNFDSPYNTRRYKGLPPGPISSPGKDALLAVARPTANDYLFFLSGDDDRTYYGRTDAEHQQNIEQHCKKKCQII